MKMLTDILVIAYVVFMLAVLTIGIGGAIIALTISPWTTVFTDYGASFLGLAIGGLVLLMLFNIWMDEQ